MKNQFKLLTVSAVFFLAPELFSGQQLKSDTVKTQDNEGVVVTALGIKREKRALGYASQEVKGEEITNNPTTREDILMQLINQNSFRLDYKEYHYYYSTLGSMITYLIDKDKLKFGIDGGKLYYFN